MADEPKVAFAAMPLRALSDPALAGADLRALGVVAAHDRFAKNRTGCFASYKRLAAMAGLAIETLKRSVSKLVELGYLRSEQNPMDARRRVLFVEYTEADVAMMRGDGRSFTKPGKLKVAPLPKVGDDMVTENSGPASTADGFDRSNVGDQIATETSKIGDRQKRYLPDSIGKVETNIFCEADKKSRETLLGKGNEFTAPTELMASAERSAKDALSGRIAVAEGVDRLKRDLGRVRSYGDKSAAERVSHMINSVIADAPRRDPGGLGGLFASPMEIQAIREARERGEPVPAWVRPEVRGAA